MPGSSETDGGGPPPPPFVPGSSELHSHLSHCSSSSDLFKGQICLLLVQWDLRGDMDHLPHSVGGSRLESPYSPRMRRRWKLKDKSKHPECDTLPPCACPLHCSRKRGAA